MSGEPSARYLNGTRPLLAFALALGLGSISMQTPTVAVAEEVVSSIARGGRLYDNWYKEIRKASPTSSHPAYPANGKFAGDPAVNWLCTECHGWDYKGKDGVYAEGEHYTGIKGIRGMAGTDPDRIVTIVKDDTHALVPLDILDDEDFRDLANFVSMGQIDMDAYIDPTTRKFKGNPSQRHFYYQTICANCHGRDGLKIRAIPPLGRITNENPWLALHNVLNGRPDAGMLPLRVFDIEILIDVLSYVQTFPTNEDFWSIVRGGRLYDNWFKEIYAPEPTQSHPSYPSDRVYANSPKTNWRCKECHGWDYMGRDGANGSGRHFTGIVGIRAMAGADPRRIIAIIKDETHRYRGNLDYRASLSEEDFQDLANFVSKGQIDMDRYIDRDTMMFKGDGTKGETFFNTICAVCHGRDGMQVSALRPLGDVAKENPWRALHTILSGHPGEEMPPLRVLGDLGKLTDILTYVQALPTEN